MNKPARVESKRDEMPQTARWVDARRAEWGREHVHECIRRAVAGEPGHFYAIENGQFLGTPFAAGTEVAKWQDYAVATGCTFAAFMRNPEATARGKD